MYQIIGPAKATQEDDLLIAQLTADLITQDPYRKTEAKTVHEDSVRRELPIIIIDLSDPIKIMHRHDNSKFGPKAIYITRGGFVTVANEKNSKLGNSISIETDSNKGELIGIGLTTDPKEASRVISNYLLAKENTEGKDEHLKQR